MKKITALLALIAFIVAQIPKEYDARKQYPECVTPVRDQGQCGSCWAFSMTGALSERFCIHSKGKMKPVLSAQYIINCDTAGQAGCNGGVTTDAYIWVVRNGCPSTPCVKYYSGSTGRTGSCPSKCDDGSPLDKYYATKGYAIRSSETAMQEDILRYGPISASFMVYTDFTEFFMMNPKGIYVHKSGSLRGGHAINVVGWGEENGVKYWICQNSWGEKWGDNGYFKIRRGTNECQIESRRLAAGLPKVDSLPEYAIPLESLPPVVDNAPIKIEITKEIIDIAEAAYLQAKRVNSLLPKIAKVVECKSQVVSGFKYFITVQLVDGSYRQFTVYQEPVEGKI
jgi:cathepsin B